jgi:hypothetical protein
MSATDGKVNKGFIENRPAISPPARGGRTFIVTGLHRSGTSLIASILRQVGIFMGAEINDIVHEDIEMVKLLTAKDIAALTRLIADRDATYGTWGFKFPMLSQSLGNDHLALFSDPHIIIPFRDPVSVAVRNSLSEYREPMKALRTAVDDQSALLSFIERLDCPTLLLSYEKSLVFPGDFIDTILQFCGLPRSDGLRDSLIRLIEPNRQLYVAQARRRFEGMIDGVSGGSLHGWCRLTGDTDPVALDLLVDDRLRTSFVADIFRQDLLDAGFGSGHHGFTVDLAKLRLRPHQVIRVKVATHGDELGNGGRRLDAYRL